MAAYQKFNCFSGDVATKLHNLNTDTLKILLTNVAPLATNTVKGNLTEIAAGNGYVAGGSTAAFVSGDNAAGSYKLILAPVVFTASGGNFAQFQWACLYNATAAGLNLIGFWDYGTGIILTHGNSFTVSLDQTNGTFTIV
jgi:hypothetical protein